MVKGLRTAERYRLREWPTYQQGLPSGAGVYTIWDRERLIYVGFTTKMPTRLSQHRSGKPSSAVCWWVMQRRVIPKLTEKERRALRAGRRLAESLEYRARMVVGGYTSAGFPRQ